MNDKKLTWELKAKGIPQDNQYVQDQIDFIREYPGRIFEEMTEYQRKILRKRIDDERKDAAELPIAINQLIRDAKGRG